MNKRNLLNSFILFPRRNVLSLIICSICFIIGSLVGTSLSRSDLCSNLASSYVLDSLSACADVSFWQILILYSGHLIVSFALGFSALGIITLPIFCAARGLLFSLSVSIAYCALGIKGFIYVFLFFVFPALFTVPCFFIVSSQSLSTSFSIFSAFLRNGRGAFTHLFTKQTSFKFFVCFAAVILAALCSEFFYSRFLPKLFSLYI